MVSACFVQVGPPPPWLEERKPDEWKPRDVANAVLIDRSALLCLLNMFSQTLFTDSLIGQYSHRR